MLLEFRKCSRVGGGEDGMEVLLVALATRMTSWAVGGRRSHPSVYFSPLHCTAITGSIASAFCNLVAPFLNTPVKPM